MRYTIPKFQKSALRERFQQILDEKLSSLTASQIHRDPTLSDMSNALRGSDKDTEKGKTAVPVASFADAQTENHFQDRKFSHVYQKEIAYAASESLLRSQSARSTANTIDQKPWDGAELMVQASIRMITDAVPPMKSPETRKTPNRIMSAPVPWQERVISAREQSMDYKVGRTDKEKEDFREMYKERLLGPSMFVDSALPKATLGLIGTLADARINAAIDQRTGKFEAPEMDSVRGKPLERARLANSNDTAFFINDILSRQECLPPWIESQQGTERGILAFRLDLQKKWFSLLVTKLGKDKIIAVEQARATGFREFSVHVKDYERAHLNYIEQKTLSLNKEIRSYNLQCPSPALHKWKLVPATEIRKLFDHVVAGFDDLLSEWFDAQAIPTGNSKMLGLLDPGPVRLTGPALEKLDFWKLVKLIFRKEK